MVLVGSESDLEERALSVDRLKKTKDFRVKAEFEPMTYYLAVDAANKLFSHRGTKVLIQGV